MPRSYSGIIAGLRLVEDQVIDTWLATDYPRAVRSDAAQFRHACIHAMKAIGKISALIDHTDHERGADGEAIELRAELPKLLSDMIRCAAKMAQVAPLGAIDLGGAYAERAEQLAKRWGH